MEPVNWPPPHLLSLSLSHTLTLTLSLFLSLSLSLSPPSLSLFPTPPPPISVSDSRSLMKGNHSQARDPPQLEADLIIALAGSAVGHSICANLVGNLNLPLGNERASNGRSQKVYALIQRVGPATEFQENQYLAKSEYKEVSSHSRRSRMGP